MRRARLAFLVTVPALTAASIPQAVQEPAPPAKLQTLVETSGFEATSRHADVMRFVRELQRRSSLVRVETMATSAQGRELPLLVIGDPPPSSPADLRRDERAVVYFQGGIHAGEVEGKEALQMLARDMVLSRKPDYLDGLVILIAPIFNPDGAEPISTANRTRQVGPSGGVGIRYNGQNLDLNRDGVKLESPEVRGLVENVLNRWDPVLFLDSHTHNGSYHQEPVTWTWGLNPNGDPAIFDYMAEVMLPAITARMRVEYGGLTIPHGDFVDSRDPGRGWIPLGPQPRYLSNYVGLRNRLSVLNEQYPYADYETRVRGAYALCLSFLDHVHAHREEVVELVRAADRRSLERAGGAFVVEYEHQPLERLLTIEGYEMEVVEREGGRTRARPTEVKRTYEGVPYLARCVAKRTIPLPHAYLIAVPEVGVIEKLRQHGIAVERLLEAAVLEVEAFTVTELSGSGRLDQGHYTSSVSGAYSTVEREFPFGAHLVRTSQPLGVLAAHLLEPESDDGLLVWNFFDRHLRRQWSNAPQVYPVYRLHEPAMLVTELVTR